MENNMTTTHSDFAMALRRLLDNTKLFGRSEWARILGVSESAISHWVTDEHIPRPEHIRAILDTLVDDKRVADEVLEDLENVMSRPASEVTPHGTRMMPTIEHYMLKPLREAFLRALDALPPWLQEDVLRDSTERCWRLREQTPARPSIRERRQRFQDLVTTTLRKATRLRGVPPGEKTMQTVERRDIEKVKRDLLETIMQEVRQNVAAAVRIFEETVEETAKEKAEAEHR